MNIYEENGFKGRIDYLNGLAEEFGIDKEVVYANASILGRNEDFDGLVNSLEDYVQEQDDLYAGSKNFNSLLSVICVTMMVVL